MIKNIDLIPLNKDESYNQTENITPIDNEGFIYFLVGGLLFIGLCNCVYNIRPTINEYIKNKQKSSTLNNYLLSRTFHGINILDHPCSICLDNILYEDVIIKLDCNHIYHKSCISEWFKKELICPNCRNSLEL